MKDINNKIFFDQIPKKEHMEFEVVRVATNAHNYFQAYRHVIGKIRVFSSPVVDRQGVRNFGRVVGLYFPRIDFDGDSLFITSDSEDRIAKIMEDDDNPIIQGASIILQKHFEYECEKITLNSRKNAAVVKMVKEIKEAVACMYEITFDSTISTEAKPLPETTNKGDQ